MLMLYILLKSSTGWLMNQRLNPLSVMQSILDGIYYESSAYVKANYRRRNLWSAVQNVK